MGSAWNAIEKIQDMVEATVLSSLNIVMNAASTVTASANKGLSSSR
jgi:hypothetical protein